MKISRVYELYMKCRKEKEMKLLVRRLYLKDTYTIGQLFVNGIYICDTLEDKVRPEGEKIIGETAIPAGTYEVILNRSPKFKRDLPRLIDVPNFTGVLIHRGNRARDTAGCILVGENKAPGLVINSTGYEIMLVGAIQGAIERDEEIEIKIE